MTPTQRRWILAGGGAAVVGVLVVAIVFVWPDSPTPAPAAAGQTPTVQNASSPVQVADNFLRSFQSNDTRAAGALTDDAARALGEAFDRGDDLSEAERAEAAVTISAAKVVATRVVNETTSTVFEFVGARGTANRYAFDRFWRNARTLTLHDPVVYKAREVGAHFLTGERPPYTGYS
jgi:hypothetical protein